MSDAPVQRFGSRLVDAQSLTKAKEWRFTSCEDGEYVWHSDYFALMQDRDEWKELAAHSIKEMRQAFREVPEFREWLTEYRDRLRAERNGGEA